MPFSWSALRETPVIYGRSLWTHSGRHLSFREQSYVRSGNKFLICWAGEATGSLQPCFKQFEISSPLATIAILKPRLRRSSLNAVKYSISGTSGAGQHRWDWMFVLWQILPQQTRFARVPLPFHRSIPREEKSPELLLQKHSRYHLANREITSSVSSALPTRTEVGVPFPYKAAHRKQRCSWAVLHESYECHCRSLLPAGHNTAKCILWGPWEKTLYQPPGQCAQNVFLLQSFPSFLPPQGREVQRSAAEVTG